MWAKNSLHVDFHSNIKSSYLDIDVSLRWTKCVSSVSNIDPRSGESTNCCNFFVSLGYEFSWILTFENYMNFSRFYENLLAMAHLWKHVNTRKSKSKTILYLVKTILYLVKTILYLVTQNLLQPNTLTTVTRSVICYKAIPIGSMTNT